MNNDTRVYDLEDRLRKFAAAVRSFVKRLPPDLSNQEDAKQLVRSSGSIGADYIEANDSLGKKDFLMKIKICRREAKESMYWLQLIDSRKAKENSRAQASLIKEASELMRIFGAILRNSQRN